MLAKAFHLFDSSLPIGSFNYSSGVEEAYYRGLNLSQFIASTFRNVVLKGDVVAAKIAFRDPEKANVLVMASKLPRELREASLNMGKSLATLGICDDEFVKKVAVGGVDGTYPVVVARCCVSMRIPEEACLEGLAYSELAQMVYSALRLGAMDFVEGHKLIQSLLDEIRVGEEFEPFSPVLDSLSKEHERREPKVFMS